MRERQIMWARVDAEDGFPVIQVPAGTPPITPDVVGRALDAG